MMFRSLAAAIPMHGPLHQGLRQSLRGVVNYRFQSMTNDREWSVDVYHSDYFVVTARNFTQPCPSVPSAIGHLRRMLGLKRC